MKLEQQRNQTSILGVVLSAALAACSSPIENGGTPGGVGTTASGTGAGGASSGAGATGAGGGVGATGGGPGLGTCAPTVPQRVVRLTHAQVANGIGAALGPDIKTAARTAGNLPAESSREFQALFNEGETIITGVLRVSLAMAEAASATVETNYAGVTGCAVGDEACAQLFLANFAQRAFRQPLSAEGQASLTALYADLRAKGLSVEESVRWGVMGMISAPGSLYRTEFGQPLGDGSAPLTPYELASQVAYFLSDAPPDDLLLAAAANGSLSTTDGLRVEVDRLLATEAVRVNLSQAMLAYIGVSSLFRDVKDPALFPEYTDGMKNSMFTETDLFISQTLWAGGNVNDLMTSNVTYVNNVLAPIYGVAYPGAPTDDANVFQPVQLPAGQRSGLLTQASILAMRSRTDNTSVVSRGLFINGTILCLNPPPEPPATLADQVAALRDDPSMTERQKADVRAGNAACAVCHAYFDPFGIVLENYDAIGRYRATYPGDVPIDTLTQLPEQVGGAAVTSATEFITAVTEGGTFSGCLVSNLMKYALTENQLLSSDTCAAPQTHERFLQTDQTFASLVREIALSTTVTVRKVEEGTL